MDTSFAVNRALWIAVGIGVLFDVMVIHTLGWQVDVRGFKGFLLVMAGCALLSLFACYVRRDDRLFFFGNAVNQMILIGFAIEFLSYVCAWQNRPLIDASLISADHALGFDWQAWLNYLDHAHWTVPLILTLAYRTFGAQIIAVICLLFGLKRMAHGQQFIIAFYMTGIVCSILSGLWPAMGGYVHYHVVLSHFHILQPAAAYAHESVLLGLRAHRIAAVTFPLVGIVTFPSFHAAVGLLLIYAAWPVRPVRWLFVFLNIAMILSTLADGGHYLADVLAGLVIAGAAIGAVRMAFK